MYKMLGVCVRVCVGVCANVYVCVFVCVYVCACVCNPAPVQPIADTQLLVNLHRQNHRYLENQFVHLHWQIVQDEYVLHTDFSHTSYTLTHTHTYTHTFVAQSIGPLYCLGPSY